MEFKQLTGSPPDIEATMTLSRALSLQGEIANEWDDGESTDVFSNIDDAAQGEPAAVTFVIPGAEAMEVGEAFLPELDEQISKWNDELMEAIENGD